METPAKIAFWQYEPRYWFERLHSGEAGLSQTDAAQRLAASGAKRKKTSVFKKELMLLLYQFRSPLMLLLIGAVMLSAFLGDTSDVLIILFIVLSTGLLSFLQERNAGRVVEKLQGLIAFKCSVVRNGAASDIASADIVPGDILLLKAGDMIPADCLLFEANELHVNESGLTGESFPVQKQTGAISAATSLAKRENCLWQGTSIVSGSAKAVVIATGNDTVFSSITQNLLSVTETSFEKGIRNFGYFLMKITLVLSVFILAINLLNHKNIVDAALFALALAVGMAPELLPAITTIAMSAGAKRMLSKKVIVKKLPSIQNLGEINLLCTDKTGTITEGVIGVSAIVNTAGIQDDFVKELAYWNAFFESGYSNPVDEALKQLQLPVTAGAVKTGEVPYDFVRKRLSIAVTTNNKTVLISKGAFREVAAVCTKIRLADATVAAIGPYCSLLEEQFTQFGDSGLRAIAISYKPVPVPVITKADETELVFAGFILLQDPVKPGIAEAIANLKKQQVDLKIITGDNHNVARSIALKIGIDNPVIMTGEVLLNSGHTDETLATLAAQTHIFAEVEPHQKELLVRSLRKKYTVAYMGDGINDVSAINAADVGISVDNAVDVAKDAADFVLMEKDLNVLVDGISEGRKTFANTLKYIYINTGATFGNMCSVAVASLAVPFLPMLPKQILLTNFITDFPYLAVSSDNVDTTQTQRPGRWNLKLIRNYMLVFGIHSSVFDITTFMVLMFGFKVKEAAFQTGWFIESVLSELFILFIIRTHQNFFKSRPAKALFVLSLAGLVVTLLLPYMPFASSFGLVPLPLFVLLSMTGIVAAYIITADILKVWFFKKYNNRLQEN